MVSLDLIHDAAEACYYPHPDRRTHALAEIVERLVLPADLASYTIDQMEDAIRAALRGGDDHAR